MDQDERLFKKHRKIIDRWVLSTCRRFPDIDVDYVKSEANEVFWQCFRTWVDNGKGKFATYLNNALKRTFSDGQWINGKSWLPTSMNPEWISVNGACGPERLVRLKQALERTGPIAKDIVELIFNPPEELTELTHADRKPFPTLTVLREYLRNCMNLTEAAVVSAAFSEIRQALKEV